jgi:hypothetical protein
MKKPTSHNPRTCSCGARGKKMICPCPGFMCDGCQLAHRCALIGSMTRQEWAARNAPREVDVTNSLVETLRKFPQVGWAWRNNAGVARGGKLRMGEAGSPDVQGFFKSGARTFGVELKNTHGNECACASCEDQRTWARRLIFAGGLYVRARTEHEALVALGLAKEAA